MSNNDNGAGDGQQVAKAAASGDELQLLYALRDRLAESIDTCPVRDLSSLTRRLQDVMKEIKDLEERRKKEGDEAGDDNNGGKWDPTDEL